MFFRIINKGHPLFDVDGIFVVVVVVVVVAVDEGLWRRSEPTVWRTCSHVFLQSTSAGSVADHARKESRNNAELKQKF